MKKGLQVLVCLILCFSLVVCMSPIRAHAIAVEAEIAIGVLEVAAAVLMALGLMPNAQMPSAFTSLQNALATAWETAGLVTGGLVSLLNPGLNSYYIQKDLLDWTKDWLFSDRIISTSYGSASLPADTLFSVSPNIYFSFDNPCTFLISSIVSNGYSELRVYAVPDGPGKNLFLKSSSGFTSPSSISHDFIYNGESWHFNYLRYYTYSTVNAWLDYPSISDDPATVCKNILDGLYPDSFLMPADIQLGEVLPSSDKSVEETYTDWADSVIEVTYEPEGRPDPESSVHYYPLWSPQFEDPEAPLDDVTQEDVWTKGIYEAITDPETGIAGNVSGIHSIVGAISGTLKEMYEWLKGKWSSLLDYLAQILAAIKALDISEILNNIWNTIKNLDVKQILLDIWDGIKGIPQLLRDLWQTVKDILAFLKTLVVPESDYLTDKLNALKDKFGFVRSIFETGVAIRSGLLSGEPPVVYVHLENAEGHYNYGGTVPILDMHFYSRYKPAGDMILGSFMWLFFIWKTVYALPDLISGIGGNVIFSPAAEETHSLVVVPRKKDD